MRTTRACRARCRFPVDDSGRDVLGRSVGGRPGTCIMPLPCSMMMVT